MNILLVDGDQILLSATKRQFPLVQVIMLTGVPTVGFASDSLKIGALSYLIKPADIEDLLWKIKDAYAQRQCLEEKIRNTQIKVLRHQFKRIDFKDNCSMDQAVDHLTKLQGANYEKNENDSGG